MQLALLKQRRQVGYLCSGLLALTVNLLLASASLAQLADTRIAFVSFRSGNGEIYLMNPDGKRVRQLTRHPKYDGKPAWSPDGQKIIFMSYRDGHRFMGWGSMLGEIYVMNADGENLMNLTQSPARDEDNPSWSPDGKQIVFVSAAHHLLHIWVMDADGGNPRSLGHHVTPRIIDWSPDWSPDGQQIAFTSNRDEDWEFEFPGLWNEDIYVMNADGTNIINLTNHPANDRRPDWSPDGNRIAFASERDGNWEVYVMNPDGTNPINLTNHPANDRRPDWSPDGQQIVFVSGRDKRNDDDKNVEIYVMNADGANPIKLTNHPAIDSSPSWGPIQPLNVTPNGRLATLWGKVKRTNTYGGR